MASRLGHDGVTTNANGWNAGVRVEGGKIADHDDSFHVYATGGSHGLKHPHRIAHVVEVNGKLRVSLYNSKGTIVTEYTL